MTKQERQNRVIARGEVSGHAHIITGDADVVRQNGQTIIGVGPDGAVMRHLIESAFVETGEEKWTGEHADIKIGPGKYKYVQQTQYDPYKKAVEKVRD
jgi:hypothetical protein